MVARRLRKIVVPFHRGPWHSRTTEFVAGDRIHPWVVVGPVTVRGEPGGEEPVAIHGVYELVVDVNELGGAQCFYTLVRVVTADELARGDWSFPVRPTNRVEVQ